MKTVKIFVASFLFFGLTACNSSAPEEIVEKDVTESIIQDSVSEVNYTEAEREAVVNKGGPTSSDQLVLEDLLLELETNLASSTGTDFETILGHWTGAFGKNKINITITSINEQDKTVQGYSVCAGNFRNLNGSYTQAGSEYAFTLNEPGDDPYDGKFIFTIKAKSNVMKGSWEPFEKKGNTAKKYELERRDFVYDAANGLFEASSRLLDETDVQNELLADLTLMRNEIYARHGYCFKDKDMRYHFEQEDWYMPMGVDIRHELTDIEIANITLIYEYEEYYEEYTDDFGR